tara:strand:- start:384 stop:662 length:279 start_codon:yes stop_codon:yes gene_type:complete
MKNNHIPFNEEIYQKGKLYTIGTNGREFQRVEYKGSKLYNGKPMMCFQTSDSKNLVVNPSFHTFVIEEELPWYEGLESQHEYKQPKKENDNG